MDTLRVSEQDQQLLLELLEREVLNLHKEIMHTDTYDYRQFLKERERSLNDLLHSLQAQISPTVKNQSSEETTSASH